MYVDLSPSDIRCMHRRINPRFRDGRSVNDTVDKIDQGLMSVHSLPTIRLVQRNGRYYAFDNRRLYVYRALQRKGKLDKIQVNVVDVSLFQPKRFTTLNDGVTIDFNRGLSVPYPHSPIERLSTSSLENNVVLDQVASSFAQFLWNRGTAVSLRDVEPVGRNLPFTVSLAAETNQDAAIKRQWFGSVPEAVSCSTNVDSDANTDVSLKKPRRSTRLRRKPDRLMYY